MNKLVVPAYFTVCRTRNSGYVLGEPDNEELGDCEATKFCSFYARHVTNLLQKKILSCK